MVKKEKNKTIVMQKEIVKYQHKNRNVDIKYTDEYIYIYIVVDIR